MSKMANPVWGVFYSSEYHPIQAGSIDGTDTEPHDHAIKRALIARDLGLYRPTKDQKAEGDPRCTAFVGRLAERTKEQQIQDVFAQFGKVKHLRLVRDIVTGASRGYAFVEFETSDGMLRAYEAGGKVVIDDRQVLIDFNRQALMPGWIPRRLGGGLSGRKESGQLRFGGRDRPFRAPLRPIPKEDLMRLGIPLPPEGHYMSRHQLPPIPGIDVEAELRRLNVKAERGSEPRERPRDRTGTFDGSRRSREPSSAEAQHMIRHESLRRERSASRAHTPYSRGHDDVPHEPHKDSREEHTRDRHERPQKEKNYSKERGLTGRGERHSYDRSCGEGERADYLHKEAPHRERKRERTGDYEEVDYKRWRPSED